MKSMKKFSLIFSAALVVFGVGAITAYSASGNQNMSDQHKMTAEEIEKHLQEFQTIQTKYAIYERNDQATIEPDDVVVSDSVDANEKTTKIVTSHGTFVKK